MRIPEVLSFGKEKLIEELTHLTRFKSKQEGIPWQSQLRTWCPHCWGYLPVQSWSTGN